MHASKQPIVIGLCAFKSNVTPCRLWPSVKCLLDGPPPQSPSFKCISKFNCHLLTCNMLWNPIAPLPLEMVKKWKSAHKNRVLSEIGYPALRSHPKQMQETPLTLVSRPIPPHRTPPPRVPGTRRATLSTWPPIGTPRPSLDIAPRGRWLC